MDLNNKVVLITGASIGIGKAIAIKLAGHGMRVVGCARRFDRLNKLADEINNEGPGSMLPIQCDLTKEGEILNMFATIKEKHGALHVVINNAGRTIHENLLSASKDTWNSMLSSNVMVPAIVAKEAFKLMQETNVTEGNIVFMNATLGHQILESFDTLDVYTVTKHALTAMIKLFRKEIMAIAPHIRCTDISPGIVKTESLYEDIGQEAAENLYKTAHPLPSSDVADAVVYILTTPSNVGINQLELESPLSVLTLKKRI